MLRAGQLTKWLRSKLEGILKSCQFYPRAGFSIFPAFQLAVEQKSDGEEKR